MNLKPILVVLSLTLVLIGGKWYTLNNGSENIGSLFEKEQYTTKQLIQLNSNKGQQCSTEANIEACYINELQIDGSGCVNTCPQRVYRLQNAELPDGKVVQFCDKDGKPNGCFLTPQGKVTAADTTGQNWQVTMVDTKK